MSQEQQKSDEEERAAIEDLLAKSRRTDIPALLQAKERAKHMLRTDPTVAPLLARLDAMLEKAEEKAMSTSSGTPEAFRNTGEVLRYLQEDSGRQIAKTKLYEDIKKGLLRKDNKKFRKLDVDKYAASLPRSTTPDGRVADAEDRQRRKDEADIRIKEATARREEIKTEALEGRYVLREQVDQGLAARAITLSLSLKSTFEANAVDLALVAGGKPTNAQPLHRAISETIDRALNEYSKLIEFTVEMGGDDDDTDSEQTEENTDD